MQPKCMQRAERNARSTLIVCAHPGSFAARAIRRPADDRSEQRPHSVAGRAARPIVE